MTPPRPIGDKVWKEQRLGAREVSTSVSRASAGHRDATPEGYLSAGHACSDPWWRSPILNHERMAALQRLAGNRAVALLVQRAPVTPGSTSERSLAEVERAIKAVVDDLDAERSVAADLVEQELGNRPKSAGKIEAGLRGVEKRGGPNTASAKESRKRIEGLEKQLEGLRRERVRVRARALGMSIKSDLTAEKVEPTKTKHGSAKYAAKHKTAGKSTKTGVVAAQDAATKGIVKGEGRTATRLTSHAGRLGVALLLPGPEDAVMLMVNFAGSYGEAWEIIEKRHTRSGIAFGIAAGLLGLDWTWVSQNLWRRFADRDVATQILAAVGKAERAFNDGLVRGHKYGTGHPQEMKNAILKEVFTAFAQEGYKTDEIGLFNVDTVARVARAVMPIADDFLRQAAKRRQAREQREEQRRRRELRESGCLGFNC